MPRTKVSKNSKRNRDAAIREEKIREFDSTLDQSINAFEMKMKQDIMEIDTEIVLMKSRIPQNMLSIKIGDLLNMNVSKFSETKQTSNFAQLQPTDSKISVHDQSSLRIVKKSKDDEGYLTEDSRGSGVDAGLTNLLHIQTATNTGRFVGPLSSAKARKSRRSRSACSHAGSALKPKSFANTGHTSRSKMRTPMISRQKAFSADRTVKDLPSSPTALLRWPKPGEMVISVTGSPVVTQLMPEQYANVNIPIRDGVLSLRPMKLHNLDPELVHKIDQETLTQIKQLQSNLELIMSFAHKSEKR